MAPRIVMLGTGDFALPTFEHLCAAGLPVVALCTQPDRPQGRKQELVPSRIKLAALARGVPVEQPENVNAPESVALLRSYEPDLLVTAAYWQILSPELLAVPRLRAINLHGSILPSYRGAAPVARAIERGETEAGVTVIEMSPRIDAGGMLAVARTPIDPDETAGALEDRLAMLGAPLVLETIQALLDGKARVIPQDKSKVSRAPKLNKDEGRVDWSLAARAVHNHIRAMQPWPIAWTDWSPAANPDSKTRVIVHVSRVVDDDVSAGVEPGVVTIADGSNLVAAAGRGLVGLVRLQIPGKKILDAEEFLRGRRVQPGDRFV